MQIFVQKKSKIFAYMQNFSYLCARVLRNASYERAIPLPCNRRKSGKAGVRMRSGRNKQRKTREKQRKIKETGRKKSTKIKSTMI